jgi:hypothetical protein
MRCFKAGREIQQKMVVLDSETEVCRVVRRTRLCKHALQSAPRNGQTRNRSQSTLTICLAFVKFLSSGYSTPLSSSLAEKYNTVFDCGIHYLRGIAASISLQSDGTRRLNLAHEQRGVGGRTRSEGKSCKHRNHLNTTPLERRAPSWSISLHLKSTVLWRM